MHIFFIQDMNELITLNFLHFLFSDFLVYKLEAQETLNKGRVSFGFFPQLFYEKEREVIVVKSFCCKKKKTMLIIGAVGLKYTHIHTHTHILFIAAPKSCSVTLTVQINWIKANFSLTLRKYITICSIKHCHFGGIKTEKSQSL